MNDPGSKKGHLILVVEDNEVMRELLTDFLSAEGYQVCSFSSATRALESLREGGEYDRRHGKKIDLLISDLAMPVMSGADFMKILKTERPEIPVVLITAFGHLLSGEDAKRLGAVAYLHKPFRLEALQASIEKATRSAAA